MCLFTAIATLTKKRWLVNIKLSVLKTSIEVTGYRQSMLYLKLYVYIHSWCNNNETETMNLEGSKEEDTWVSGGRKGREKSIINITISKRFKISKHRIWSWDSFSRAEWWRQEEPIHQECVPWAVHAGQETSCRGFALWVLEIELRRHDLVAGAFTFWTSLPAFSRIDRTCSLAGLLDIF